MKHVSVPRSRKVTKGDTIKRLESDNAALREALKELIPIAEHAKDPWDFSEDNVWKVSIDKAKDLLKPMKILLVTLLALSSFSLFAQKAVPLDSVVWVIGSVITCPIARPDSNGWIDVRDSLPRTGRHVLTYVKLCYRFMPDLPRECHSFHYVTSYDGLNLPYDFNLHEIRDHNYGTEQVVEVTHWQPLPPKPEDK